MSDDWIESALPLFRAACELPVDERAAFLDNACGPETELRRHVDAMLAWDDTADAVEPDTAAAHPVRAALEHLVEQTESAPADAASLPHLDGYRIVRFVAHGGMGVVYEAEQEHPRRRVAIKVARAEGATGERARRFELEAQLLARLSHPGIAQIFDAGTTSPEDGARPFFAMEFVEGPSLTAYAQEHLPTARAKLELMVRVCEAVGFAHREGVIHRDLKPDNVLIEAGGQPKVLDFGVAKVEAAGGFGAATLRTEAGRVIGTLGYMAPEQLGGRTKGLGPEADVYSLGVMIYELLSGRLPHELDGVTLTRALAVVTTTDAPLLGVVRPELRGDIEAVVAKALEKEPRFRYPDAAALQADIERHLRDEPVLARRHSGFHRFRKFSRRHRGLVGGVAATIVALLLGLIASLFFLGRFQQKVSEFDQLEVKVRYDRLMEDEKNLYPTWDKVGDIQKWLGECGELLLMQPEIDRTVQTLRARNLAPNDASRSLLETLTKLQPQLDDLRAHKAIVERRLSFAEAIEELTIDRFDKKWREAREAIKTADGVVASQLYGEVPIDLSPQLGLVPIGMNPVTKLWEFYHLRSVWDPAGTKAAADIEIPVHRQDGSIEVTGETGLVFVLIPGGTFWVGAQSENEDGINYDAHAIGGGDKFVGGKPPWEWLYEVREKPAFFLSKYEMTQGQWQRCVGDNPSVDALHGLDPVLTKPVNNMSWYDCQDVLARLGLVLPDEEQWEYGARAGTDTVWWTGDDEGTLEGAEDLAEQATAKKVAWWFPDKQNMVYAPWTDHAKELRFADGDGGPAPVGSYKPNGFGLYDVGGNVSEWCRVSRNRPNWRDRPKDPPPITRGGNFKSGVKWVRSAWRYDVPAEAVAHVLGLRPVMAIQR